MPTPEGERLDREARALSRLSLYDWYSTTDAARNAWREKVQAQYAE